MEFWTRKDDGSWKRWTQPGLALDAVASAAQRVVSLLVVDIAAEDGEQLFATIRLARRLATAPLEVVAGTVHPSLRWLDGVRAAGADLALLVPRARNCRWRELPRLDGSVELGTGMCPDLHVKRERELTLSVCGKRDDRMVLARRHLDRWCVKSKESCPHRQGAARE